MYSHITQSFRDCFEKLPVSIQQQVEDAYELFKQNPQHPSLAIKKIQGKTYSARIGIHWRALAVKVENHYYWYWVGSHAEYDQVIKNTI